MLLLEEADERGMKLRLRYAACLALLPAMPLKAESLDNHYTKIISSGSLTAVCRDNPYIDECKFGIGDWKPEKLAEAKSNAPECLGVCALDMYAFMSSSVGGCSYPMVRTKDFDGSSASNGVEMVLYPVAISLYSYRGCPGCTLIKTYPSALSFKTVAGWRNLPRLGSGVFYLTREFRDKALASAIRNQELTLRLTSGEDSQDRRISKKATRQYSKMLGELMYDPSRWF